MLSSYLWDPYFGFPHSHRNPNDRRRFRGFIPVWDEFDRRTEQLFEDQNNFFSENLEEKQQQTNQNQGKLTKSQRKLLKNTGATNTNANTPTNNNQELTTTDNTSRSLSIFDNLSLNDQIKISLDESDDKYIVSAKLPGFDKEHMKLQVSPDGLLTVSGEIKEEKKDENSYSKSSRFVSKSITLPHNIAQDKISAKYENGQLLVQIPKLETQKQEKDTIMIE